MKVSNTLTAPYFYYPGTINQRRSVRRPFVTRAERLTPVETSDELARKQEVVCGAILALSLVSSVVLSFWQLALP